MGNHFSCIALTSQNKGPSIKLICSDGRTRTLEEPQNAGELMSNYPEHIVCHADSFYIGQQVPALSADAELKVGETYFLLPKKWFGCVLSAASLASIAASKVASRSASAAKRSPLSTVSQPFAIESRINGGALQFKVSPEFIAKLLEDGKFRDSEAIGSSKPFLCNTPDLQKDYGQLVKSRSQHWRPKLETIREIDRNGCKRFRITRTSFIGMHKRNRA
eukprot:Gb_26414 [translate_table: standard]